MVSYIMLLVSILCIMLYMSRSYVARAVIDMQLPARRWHDFT